MSEIAELVALGNMLSGDPESASMIVGQLTDEELWALAGAAEGLNKLVLVHLMGRKAGETL